MQRQGQLNLGCTNCHDDNWDKRLAGSAITQGHPTGYPLYRLEWQSLGSLQRRLRACITGIRAQAYDYGAPELVELELYVMSRARGMADGSAGGAALGSAANTCISSSVMARSASDEATHLCRYARGSMGFASRYPSSRDRDLERLPLRERLLDHELGRLAVIAFDKSLAVEQRARVRHQRRAAADHDAVMGGIERGEANISEQFS